MIIGAEADAPPTSRLGLHLSPIRARLGSDQVTPPGTVAMGHFDFTQDGLTMVIWQRQKRWFFVLKQRELELRHGFFFCELRDEHPLLPAFLVWSKKGTTVSTNSQPRFGEIARVEFIQDAEFEDYSWLFRMKNYCNTWSQRAVSSNWWTLNLGHRHLTARSLSGGFRRGVSPNIS